MFRRTLLYARSLAHLRPIQWWYLPLRRVQRFLPARKVGKGVINPANAAILKAAAFQLLPTEDSGVIGRARDILVRDFTFLNRTERLERIDWRRTYVNRLWTYHLHYFDYAADLTDAYLLTKNVQFAESFAELAADWIEANAEGRGVGWDPYPTSVRVLNWMRSFVLMEEALPADFTVPLINSIYRQLSHLERRLEWHLLANHLDKNLCALFVGGLLLAGKKAERWRSKGGRLLWSNLAKQVQPDGAHSERSPMYHAIVLRDLLNVLAYANAVGESVPTHARRRIEGLASTIGYFVRNSTDFHLFNDSANGIALDPDQLTRLSEVVLATSITPPEGAWHLEASGFYGYREQKTGDSVIIDCGAPSPPYQPGHAHSGVLSFELDFGGKPVVVDSGLHGYDGDPFRAYVRSTAAHTTVTIDGKNQSEMWGTFRVGRRVKIRHAAGRMDDSDYVFEGAYSPYHDKSAIHRRVLRKTRSALHVEDVIEGAKEVTLQSFLHLHPDLLVETAPDGLVARSARLIVKIEAFGVDTTDVIRGDPQQPQGWYFPEFGRAFPRSTIVFTIRRNREKKFGYRLFVQDESR